jgi:hypothetical protein
MPSTIEFPFSDDEALPTIPIILSYADFSVTANALLDTGSTVNLLPYDIGLQLGICRPIKYPAWGTIRSIARFG